MSNKQPTTLLPSPHSLGSLGLLSTQCRLDSDTALEKEALLVVAMQVRDSASLILETWVRLCAHTHFLPPPTIFGVPLVNYHQQAFVIATASCHFFLLELGMLKLASGPLIFDQGHLLD